MAFEQKLILEHVDASHHFHLGNIWVGKNLHVQKFSKILLHIADQLYQQVEAPTHPQSKDHFLVFGQTVRYRLGSDPRRDFYAQHGIGRVVNGDGINYRYPGVSHSTDTVSYRTGRNPQFAGDDTVGQTAVFLE